MFGCCVAGRPLQTNLQQIDDTHAIFELPAASTINHLCVFLLGSVPFPDGYGATVHLHWPGKGFQLLGMLSNDKPSAIFRVRGTFSSQSSRPTLFGDASGTSTPTTAMVTDVDTTPAYLGIAIEPLSTIEAEVATIPSAITRPAITQADTTLLAERIVKHLFNYVSGFAAGGPMTPETPIPLALIARWYEAFVSKVRMVGIGFLETQQ